MSGVVSSFSDGILHCSLCTKQYNNPKLLPCSHTVCKGCLSEHISSIDVASEESSTGFPCPVCQTRTAAPVPGIPREIWSDQFPTNHLASTLLDSEYIHQHEKQCDPCRENQRSKMAVFWCTQCSEALCSSCAEAHRAMKVSRHHKLCSMQEDRGPSTKTPGLDLACPEHKDKVIEVFCVDHNKPCCVTCMTELHRKCDKVATIEELAKEIRCNNEAELLLGRLQQCHVHMGEIIKNSSMNVQELEKRKQEIINRIQSVRKEINSLLQKMEVTLIDSLNATDKKEIVLINDQIDRCVVFQKVFANARDILEAVVAQGTDSSLFLTFNEMKDKCVGYEQVLKTEHNRLRDVNYHFTSDKLIEQMRSTLRQLGHIRVERTRSNLPPLPSHCDETPGGATSREKWDPPMAKRCANEMIEFSAKTKGDNSDCYLTSAAVLPDDRILLVDYNNKSLKLFTKDGALQDELKMDCGPWDVALMETTRAAVTLPSAKRIQVVSINQRLVMQRSVKTSFSPHGIATMNKSWAVTCCESGSVSLKLLKEDGQVSTSISTNAKGRHMFRNPQYLTRNLSGTQVLVSDNGSGTVSAFTIDGICRFRYTHADLKWPAGVSVDPEGNYYLCGYGSANVHQLSPEGECIQVLLTQTSFPKAISFQANGNWFITTNGSVNNQNSVRLYQMC